MPTKHTSRTEWDQIMAVLIRRSGGRCEALRFSTGCTGVASDAHHVLGRGVGGRDEVDNLLYVCRPCHREITEHPRRARTAGLLRRVGDRPGTDLVPVESEVCPHCRGGLEHSVTYQDAFIRHGGYGGTRRTEVLACAACNWSRTLMVATEAPPKRR